MEPAPVNEDAYERAIEALVHDLERRLSERLERNARETTSALMADAAKPRSPTAIRSLLTAVDILGMGSPRRRWRRERRADEERLRAARANLRPS